MADVGVDARLAGNDAVFTYAADQTVRIGEAHFVPLGTRWVPGWVLRVYEADEEELGFPFAKLKPLTQPIRGLELPARVIDLVHRTALDSLSPVSQVIAAAAPPGLKDRICRTWERVGSDTGPLPVGAVQQEILAMLDKGPIREMGSRSLTAPIRRGLQSLRARGLVEARLSLAPPSLRAGGEGTLRLTPDEKAVDLFLNREGRRRPAQAMTLMALQGSGATGFTRQEIRALSGVTDQTIRSLFQAGLLVAVDEAAAPPSSAKEPSLEQKAALDAILPAVAEHRPERFLLFGVTGSGKTEVYLQAAAAALRAGRQILYLVPEIALTAQVVAQLRGRFGRSVAVLHSNLSPGERLDSWSRVQRGEAPVVLGPRSALFAPLANLGLIVVDEEHEGSYKQDTAPRYHAKKAALQLADLHGCPVLLGSATPSLESWTEAKDRGMTLLTMRKRPAEARLPEVRLVDLREGFRDRRPSLFSPELERAILETLAAGNQTILFHNRRAYSPFLVCRSCGERIECPDCSVTLSWHRGDDRLLCHHCDHTSPVPTKCPKCGEERLRPFGFGSERVEEEVGKIFPKARVARLDRDIARKKGALEEIFARFRGGEIDVLVGTQMIAKGLDFPKVTLVGVVAADMSLGVPDFRAGERTHQLLSQVAGRAGRGRDPGRVIIQTMQPEHPSLQSALHHDYEAMAASLLPERMQALYPPYSRLVNVIVSGPDREEARRAARRTAEALRLTLPRAKVLGPAPCALERLQNRWRFHALVKMAPDADPSPIPAALDGIQQGDLRVTVDVDPGSLT
ncbi:MAG: primosomal protein N' [Fimbriimonadaceae bacterium]|nr:primosomal protein N' [Fimbriimonadaceae bacterium]